MAGHMERAGKSLRPHTKTHKAPQIARLQVEAGAIGVSTATAWEAIVMIDAGIDDVLVANEVVGPARIRALADAGPGRAGVTVAVDSAREPRRPLGRGRRRRLQIGVLVEVDVGMNRGGVRSKEEALEVARHAREPSRDRVARRDGLRGPLHARARPRPSRHEAGARR